MNKLQLLGLIVQHLKEQEGNLHPSKLSKQNLSVAYGRTDSFEPCGFEFLQALGPRLAVVGGAVYCGLWVWDLDIKLDAAAISGMAKA